MRIPIRFPVWLAGLSAVGLILLASPGAAEASPRPGEEELPGSEVLDLAAEALGWTERTNGKWSVSHTEKSGDVSVYSMIKWDVYPVSYYVFAGNQHGTPFGETEGFQWGSGCSEAGGCIPPTNSQYFQFNFDMNRDGDNNIDTPPERYLGFFCEVTVTAPKEKLYAPAAQVTALCTKVLEKAVEVRASMQIPLCVGVNCPTTKCEGNTLWKGGTCDPKTGGCVYPSFEDCGSIGCNPGTGECNRPEPVNRCEGVTCDPAFCEGDVSYSDPACDPADGACAYFRKDECGAAGCNPDTGLCNNGTAGSPCGGGLAPLGLLPLALIVRRPKRNRSEADSGGGSDADHG
ncbi:MAG: hypothetical protein JW929_00050 [Anaerolineales bacterium]|nr:hypothetical protein [Anaerolineales bacterium]